MSNNGDQTFKRASPKSRLENFRIKDNFYMDKKQQVIVKRLQRG